MFEKTKGDVALTTGHGDSREIPTSNVCARPAKCYKYFSEDTLIECQLSDDTTSFQ